MNRTASESSEPPIRSRPFQSRWWFVATALLVSIVGVLSTNLGGGDLEPRAASDLGSLLGGFTAISIMVLGLQLVLVGILSDPQRPGRVLMPRRLTLTAAVAVLVGVVAGFLTTLLIVSGRTFETQAAITVGVVVATLTVSIPSRSVLLGEERWRDLALIAVLASVARFAVTAALAHTDGVGATLGGLMVGEVIGAATAIVLTRRTPRAERSPFDVTHHLVVGTAASIGLMSIVMLSSLSLSRFLGEQAVDFNKSAAVARLVFVLIFTVAFVFFPAMARFDVGSVDLRRNFHDALILATTMAIVACGAILIAPSRILDLVGSDADAADTTLRLLAVAFACYGLAGVSLMQYIAHGSRFALCTWPFIAVMVIGQLVVETAVALAWLSLTAAVILLLVASLPALARVQPVLRPRSIDSVWNETVPRESVTVVIPSYNPGPAVLETVKTTISAFEAAGATVEIIVVSDGSTDGSDVLVRGAGLPRVRVIQHPSNRGKGAALRTGFAAADTSRIAFVDADGDIDPKSLVGMVRIHEELDADIVFGSKRHAESTVSMSILRRIYSRTYALLIRTLFQLDIADTQTGVKVYSGRLIAATLPVLEEEGFALDLELFVASRASGFAQFVEVPVVLVRTGGSTVSLRTVGQMLVHTMRIFWRAKVTLRYLRAGHSLATPARGHLAPAAAGALGSSDSDTASSSRPGGPR